MAVERAAAPQRSGGVTRRLDVVAVTAYPEITPGARVRVVEMGHHLEHLRVFVDFRPTVTDAEYELIASAGMHPRKMTALALSGARAARFTKSTGPKLTMVHRLRSLIPIPADDHRIDVYDFDDALYVTAYGSHRGRAAALKREASRSIAYMRAARLVVAGNRVLAAEASRHGRRVEVVPSCVDPTLQPRRRHHDAEVLTLGWTGTRTTSAYLSPVLEAMRTLRARHRPVRLVVMGAASVPDEPWLEQRPWSLEAEREMLSEIDIGVMPLPDDPWTRGKCGYKLLRYFSAGLPTIATPVGVNADLIAGGHGLSATSSTEWADAVEHLISDSAARQQIGDEARRFVERDYSYQVWAPRLADLFRTLAT